jgi:hypothetical protein
MASSEDKQHTHDEDDDGPRMTAEEYLRTRIPTLKPPLTVPPNPIRILRSLTMMNWLMFISSFLAWSWDSFDFFTGMLFFRDFLCIVLTQSSQSHSIGPGSHFQEIQYRYYMGNNSCIDAS